MKNNLYYQDEYVGEKFSLHMLKKLFSIAGKHKKLLWGSIFSELFYGIVSLLPSILYSVIVSAVFPTDGALAENYLLISGLCIGGLVLVWIGQIVGAYLENIIPVNFGILFCAELRSEIFNHLTKLSFRYYDTHSTGKILVRVTNYIDDLSDMFSQLFYCILYCSGVILVGLIWIFALDWRIGLGIAGAFVPFAVLMFLLSTAIHRRAGKDRNKNANYTAFVTENIQGAEVVRAYNRGALNGEVADGLFEEYGKAFMRTTRVREAFFPLSHGFTNAILSLVVYGVALAILLTGWGGVLKLGTVIAIGTVLGEVTGSLGSLCNEFSNIFTLTTNIERIFDTIETPVEITDKEGAIPLTECRGDVRFNHVDFSYVDGVPVLKDFTLEAKAGETVALVGATGSGKTTVVGLLSRFYDVKGGSVTVDGKDVRDYTLSTLRGSVGAMMQDTYIFSGTVLDNIRFARPNATDEECIAAAKAACADGFICRLPEGYATEISEDYALSGGERQLLSFARLILADPKIVVLDEATSHVDTQTELEVQKSLKTLLEGRTSFVIAHRLSTIRGADKIVVIDEGKIVEQGTNAELIARGGAYARMVSSFHLE